jgi:hypothetical protein
MVWLPKRGVEHRRPSPEELQSKTLTGMVQDIDAEGTRDYSESWACEGKLRFGALSEDGRSIKYSIRVKGRCAKCNVRSRDYMKV